MASKLSEKKIQQMWAAYCERQCVEFVSKKCRVSPTTVRRYRSKENWDERLKGIKEAASKKADETVAEMLARQARQAREIQSKALKRIKKGFKTARDATDAYFKATAEERVLRGEPSDRVEVSILEAVKQRYVSRSKKKTNR